MAEARIGDLGSDAGLAGRIRQKPQPRCVSSADLAGLGGDEQPSVDREGRHPQRHPGETAMRSASFARNPWGSGPR
jgi:hypothetical protein